jgi:dihydrofolate reductase
VSTISLILARADNGVIGNKGKLPWHLPEDMRRFRDITMGKPCIMGRKTWDGLPEKFRPLPGRDNIVVTRKSGFPAEGAKIVHSLDAAFAAAGTADEIMVIGGAEIFAKALPRAGRIYLTRIHAAPPGEILFPAFSASQWLEMSREDHVATDGMRYSFALLERKLP